MSKKLLSSLAALVTAIAGMGIVKADTGYSATFTSSITYSNVGTGTASVLMNFYDQSSGTAIPITRPSLATGASSSLFLGSTSLAAGFNGSAIISSDQPIAATAVQIATNTGTVVKNRPLSNGFSSGAPQVLIATTLKNKFNFTERFNVQNASSANVDLTVNFYDADNAGILKNTQTVANLPPGAAKTFDLGTIAALPDGFNGSAVVTAIQSGSGTPGTPANIVASALELNTTGNAASAFEGVTGGANTLYMPSALCNAFGGFNSFYAIGNADTTNAVVAVTYSNGATDSATITPGAKKSFNTCLAAGMTQGFSGAATIVSTGGKIVGIGKVQGLGVTTAFLGETAGSAKLACPYVRWTPTAVYNSGQRQRGFLAIQNVGGALAAGVVTVSYIDANGVVKATQTLNALATGAKQSVSSLQTALGDVDFGFDGTNFGGGVTIVGPAGSQLVAITRIQSSDPGGASGYGEDYNCIPF